MRPPSKVTLAALYQTAKDVLGPDKKRRHHHVWQHYMRSWEVNGQVYCLSNGAINPRGMTVLAVERYFYRVKKLTQADLTLLTQLFVAQANQYAKKLHQDFISYFAVADALTGKSQATDDLVDLYRTNIIENHHMHVEREFLPLLDGILNKDISFYESDHDCIIFFNYLANQQMRTKGVQSRSIARVKDKTGYDLTRAWPLMSYMFAVNVGAGLYVERQSRKLSLIENSTGHSFITGDQPVINLDATNYKTTTDRVTLYYPVSPVLSLILSEKGEESLFSTKNITSEDVRYLNKRIFEASHSQVFASSRSVLEALMP